MEFVDTHAHLYSDAFDEDRAEVVRRAQEAGVTRLLLPDVDSESRAALEAMSEEYGCCTPMVGLHPTSINENPAWREELAAVESLLAQGSEGYCAVGEIGIDLYWSQEWEAEQREAFVAQIEMALRYGLPVAIHSRDAWEAIIEELTPFASRGVRGVIHAFTGSIEHYRTLLTLGDFVFGIGGVVTFKKSALAPVVAEMSLNHIVLETDAPYLIPTPHRGKRNESSYIPLIAATVADLHATSLAQVAEVTTANAARIFSLSVGVTR
ncbi:MAG: TatD family hydrolase [Rikenellaceae bacterium]